MTLSFETNNELHTLRDWLRFAVSRFNVEGLSYGHGTASALDEAAFLILHTLHLPIDRLEPFLDARLLMSEREALRTIIDRRISTRKPAAYLTGTAYIQDHAFYVDERVIVPRSFIGELLANQALAAVVPDAASVTSVLDLCTGSGCLAILAALAFPNAVVHATDLSGEALAVARRNIADYGLADRIGLDQGDLFAPVTGRRFDVIIANPPYVTDAEVQAFPPEHRAEPALAHAGGKDGMDFARRILAAAAGHLTPAGHLIVEIGQGRAVIEAEFSELPFLWLDTEASSGEVFALAAATLAKPRPPPVKRRKRAAK